MMQGVCFNEITNERIKVMSIQEGYKLKINK